MSGPGASSEFELAHDGEALKRNPIFIDRVERKYRSALMRLG
jgi:hypothetical protein